jgi:hypothetical protein
MRGSNVKTRIICETYVSNSVYFVFDNQITQPLTVMVRKVVKEGNGSLSFVMLCCEYKNKQRLGIFDKVCFYEQVVPKRFHLDGSSILFFTQV